MQSYVERLIVCILTTSGSCDSDFFSLNRNHWTPFHSSVLSYLWRRFVYVHLMIIDSYTYWGQQINILFLFNVSMELNADKSPSISSFSKVSAWSFYSIRVKALCVEPQLGCISSVEKITISLWVAIQPAKPEKSRPEYIGAGEHPR